jgi:methylmalonyl-CoA carboxyltransferase large subunit
MIAVESEELLEIIKDLRSQLSALTARVERFEKVTPEKSAETLSAPAVSSSAAEPEPVEISEEELLAISAAIAAFMGVRAHIKQIRLISSNMWAQEGRATIQASHRLHA